MEVLPVDVLEELLSQLDDNKIVLLYQKEELRKRIRKVFKRNLFWKKRVEWKLNQNKTFCQEILVDSGRWKWVYSIFTSTLSDKLLEEVCKLNCFEVLEIILLDSRFNTSCDLNSCCYTACELGHSETVEILLRNSKVNPFSVVKPGWVIAIKKDQDKVFEMILKDDRVNNLPPDFLKNRLLESVSKENASKIVKVLLADSRINPSYASNSAFYTTCVNGYVESVEAFLECERFVLSKDYSFILSASAEKGHSEVVKLLLKDGRLNPGWKSNMAIWKAANNGDTAIVELLLADPRVDPSDHDNMAIIAALICGHIDIVKLLLTDKRVVVSEYNFEDVVRKSNVEIVRILLEDGRVNPSFDNNLPIRIATKNGNDRIVRLLLADDRVDPTINNNELLDIALNEGRYDIVELLKRDKRVQALL